VNRDEMRADYRVLPYVTRRGAPITTRTSFVVERAEPGLEVV
jgi:alkaline phosphatase D